MKLIVGLGNPGEKYKNTRHNIGFEAIDFFKGANGFPNFALSNKFKAEISEGTIGDEKIIIAKPQTFMNDSGKSVKTIIKHYKLPMADLFVIHDDIDLPLGKIKISIDRGTAGHKGADSIMKEIKTKKFTRFRIGIQPQTGKDKSAKEIVLRKFKKEEEALYKKAIKKTAEAVKIAIETNVERAMNSYN